jgi:hypothetical protein
VYQRIDKITEYLKTNYPQGRMTPNDIETYISNSYKAFKHNRDVPEYTDSLALSGIHTNIRTVKNNTAETIFLLKALKEQNEPKLSTDIKDMMSGDLNVESMTELVHLVNDDNTRAILVEKLEELKLHGIDEEAIRNFSVRWENAVSSGNTDERQRIIDELKDIVTPEVINSIREVRGIINKNIKRDENDDEIEDDYEDGGDYHTTDDILVADATIQERTRTPMGEVVLEKDEINNVLNAIETDANDTDDVKTLKEIITKRINKNSIGELQKKITGHSSLTDPYQLKAKINTWIASSRTKINGGGIVGRGLATTTSRPDTRVKLGDKYFLNKNELSKNRLLITYKRDKKFIDQILSDSVGVLMYNLLLNETPITSTQFNSITEDEQETIFNIIKKLKITSNTDSIYLPKNTTQSKQLKRFELLKGMVIAGNDNDEIITELKNIIVKLKYKGLLTKNTATDTLLLINELGY